MWREICHIVCVIFRSANNVHCAKNCANQECMRKLSHSCLKSFHCLPAFWLHKNPFSLKKQYINFLVMIFRWWWFLLWGVAYLVLVNDRTRYPRTRSERSCRTLNILQTWMFRLYYIATFRVLRTKFPLFQYRNGAISYNFLPSPNFYVCSYKKWTLGRTEKAFLQGHHLPMYKKKLQLWSIV